MQNMVRKGKERAAPLGAAAADDDEASETATQLHGQVALWLSGAARQARADAHAHQVAAGKASGAKRTAKAMTPEERLAKRAADEKRRWDAKKAAQAAAASGDAEAVAALEAAAHGDAALEAELGAELEARICERFGEVWLMDTHTRDTIELELRMEGYGADRSDDGRQVYSLPHAELQRRVADNELALPGEEQMDWDLRVMHNRLACGAPLGQHLEQLQRLLREPPRDPIADHVLVDYGTEPGHWQPQGAESASPPPPPPPPQAIMPPPPPADAPCRCTSCGHILPIWGCDDGCVCLYAGDPEAFARHRADECSPACTPRWSQMLVNVRPDSAEPCAYCVKYAAGRCMGVDDFPNQEMLQQQRRCELQGQLVSPAPPPPPPPSSGSTGLLAAVDEGDMPYFYVKDTSRTLAAKSELLDTSVSNPEWMRDRPMEASDAAEQQWPPERSDYDLGERGQCAYRQDRAHWYRTHTGRELTGSIAEHNDQWDDYKRNFRTRGNHDARTEPVSDLPSEPYVPNPNIRPMHHWYDW